MNRAVAAFVAALALSAPALGQVRPEDCRPVFPVVDKAAEVVPDVVTQPAGPAVATTRRFFGLPFLIPLLAAGGACIIACGGGNGGNGNEEPASPA